MIAVQKILQKHADLLFLSFLLGSLLIPPPTVQLLICQEELHDLIRNVCLWDDSYLRILLLQAKQLDLVQSLCKGMYSWKVSLRNLQSRHCL